MTPYRLRQDGQLQRFLAWSKAQGGEELPVQLTTYFKPAQQRRIAWLRAHVQGTVLELGCSWGYVLAAVTDGNPRVAKQGHVGIDIAEHNVLLARILNPYESSGLTFQQGDLLGLPYDENLFDTVMLPEVLEHLDWPGEVHTAVWEAIRLTRKQVLITIPDGREDTPEACSFKHHYLFDEEHAQELLSWMNGAHLEYHQGFALIAWSL